MTVALRFALAAAHKGGNSSIQQTTLVAAGELGFFTVDSPLGDINGIFPGSPGYVQAALAAGRRQVVFNQGDAAGTERTLNVAGSSLLAFYYIPGGTADQLLASNPTNSINGALTARFSFDNANPDAGISHFSLVNPEKVGQALPTLQDPLQIHVLDKLFGTLSDFDDLTFTVNI
jgi:hypothetical protein